MPKSGQTIANYEIIEQLGGGGMGIVYRARDRKLGRDVALKFLPPELSRDDDANERFMQEARAASALNHPNVCVVHDIRETDDGELYLVMPLYEGNTLKYRIKDGPLRRSQALKAARQVASGLAAAHKKGIVHRDIKPANVMLTDEGRAIILDFGLAKLSGGLDLTKSGSTVGTAYYMSPEQVRGEPVDFRTDIWALGILLFEILTGDRPFVGDYEQAVTYAIQNSDPPDVLEPAAGAIVRKCLDKDADNRYQTASEVEAALEQLQATSSSGTNASPTTDPVGTEKTESKPAKTFATIGLSAAGLIVILLGLWFFLKPTSPGQSDAGPTRLVVLPFDNLGSPDDDYFAEGITEEITTRLASLSGMAVISQNTAVRYKKTDKTIREIGSELDVNFVLGGSVRWDKRGGGADVVRITPRLIRVSDDTNIWTESYERPMDRVFAIQSEVARDVAGQLNVTLVGRERAQIAKLPTENAEAYQWYLRGIALRSANTTEMGTAASAFQTAVDFDPNFLEAQYALAQTYLVGAWVGTIADWERDGPRGIAVADRIHEVAPGSLEDHLAQGYRLYYVDLDFKRALSEFEAAQAVDEQSITAKQAQAYIQRRLGNMGLAADLLDEVFKSDPQNFQTVIEAAVTNMFVRRNERADELFETGIQLQPNNPQAYCAKSMSIIRWKGAVQEARFVESSAMESSEDLPCWWADLADRDFEAILSKLDSVNPTALGRHWYGELFPYQEMHYYFRRAIAARLLGRAEQERASWIKLLELIEQKGGVEIPVGKYRNPQAVLQVGRAVAHAGLGDRQTAENILADLRRGISHDAMLMAAGRKEIAMAYALMDDEERAIDVLEEDLGPIGFTTDAWLKLPYWDLLRDNPRFQALQQSSP